MKTREEMRFEAAMSFATVMLTTQRLTGTSFCMDEAMHYADLLLDELDRTAPKPETPSLDADGWIEHRPGDPAPSYEGQIKVAFRCSDEDSGSVSDFNWSAHDSDSNNPDYAIIAWKPA